jgi:hypothetical protein
MLPLALAYIIIVAAAVLALDYFAVPRDWRFGAWMIGLNVVLAIFLFFVFDRGRLVSPASRIVRSEDIARLRALSARGRITPAPQGD